MNNFRNNITNWIKNNIDFALLLAVFTETPRWAVAFMAINEPLWVGIPLGVLLAFATSHAWRTYFETRNRNLFIFNVVSMLIAVAVIAPVLFAMTDAEAHEVNISHVLSTEVKAVWTTLLALTTFIPLVQLAAVQGLKMIAPKQPATQRTTRTVKVTRTDEQSEQYTIVQPEQLVAVEAERPTAIVPATDEQKRAVLAEMLNNGEKINKTQLARQWEIGRTTLYAWIEELQTEAAQ